MNRALVRVTNLEGAPSNYQAHSPVVALCAVKKAHSLLVALCAVRKAHSLLVALCAVRKVARGGNFMAVATSCHKPTTDN